MITCVIKNNILVITKKEFYSRKIPLKKILACQLYGKFVHIHFVNEKRKWEIIIVDKSQFNKIVPQLKQHPNFIYATGLYTFYINIETLTKVDVFIDDRNKPANDYKKHIIRKNNKLSIPLRSHKHFNNLKNGIVSHVQCHLEQIVKSILVSKEGIEVRFKFKPLAKESQFKQRKLGIDQGQRKLFTAFSVDKNNVENINDGLYLKQILTLKLPTIKFVPRFQN